MCGPGSADQRPAAVLGRTRPGRHFGCWRAVTWTEHVMRRKGRGGRPVCTMAGPPAGDRRDAIAVAPAPGRPPWSALGRLGTAGWSPPVDQPRRLVADGAAAAARDDHRQGWKVRRRRHSRLPPYDGCPAGSIVANCADAAGGGLADRADSKSWTTARVVWRRRMKMVIQDWRHGGNLADLGDGLMAGHGLRRQPTNQFDRPAIGTRFVVGRRPELASKGSQVSRASLRPLAPSIWSCTALNRQYDPEFTRLTESVTAGPGSRRRPSRVWLLRGPDGTTGMPSTVPDGNISASAAAFFNLSPSTVLLGCEDACRALYAVHGRRHHGSRRSPRGS